MCFAIPSNYPGASVIGCIKGESAIVGAQGDGGKDRDFTGEHFWARMYAVFKVGFELEQVCQYIRAQEGAEGSNTQF